MCMQRLFVCFTQAAPTVSCRLGPIYLPLLPMVRPKANKKAVVVIMMMMVLQTQFLSTHGVISTAPPATMQKNIT